MSVPAMWSFPFSSAQMSYALVRSGRPILGKQYYCIHYCSKDKKKNIYFNSARIRIHSVDSKVTVKTCRL